MYQDSFYKSLFKNLNGSGVIFINFIASNTLILEKLLILIRKTFSYITLLDFDNYKNIILITSKKEIPSKQELAQLNLTYNNVFNVNFIDFINRLIYLPVKQ
ncbi:hypothetical protein SAMN02745724_02110 [Pseudoalteromonas denitrificans DSM 6059]|uniref:Uncharacterized protein n=1 Tax=Pseudoalteromonas denitrificans DSM 6059 TaxID=1123010 RepID=A0A1I1KMK6_9GAMM|nr:hypothetical protein SAMN02745724_02110 [Pseudoalteromonas denitrificans DSM 6059]